MFSTQSSTFNPFSVSTNPIQTTKPNLACVQLEKNILQKENVLFNLTVLLADAVSLLKIPNIAWNVFELYYITI